jgi:hypothetical protein
MTDELGFKTPLEKALEYEAAIDGLLSGAMQSYSLPTGVSVTKHNIDVLEKLYQHYKKQAYRGKYGWVTKMVQGAE